MDVLDFCVDMVGVVGSIPIALTKSASIDQGLQRNAH